MADLSTHERQRVLRILDANFNRASEGLRVVEEYARFALNDLILAAAGKTLRHELTAALNAAARPAELTAARDTEHDVGTQVQTAAEYARADLVEVVLANGKRVEQSLRAIEEYGKVISPELGARAEALRYQAYTLAKQLTAAASRPALLAQARLYALIDGGADLEAFQRRADALVSAGVDVVQLRDKKLADRELLDRARVLRSIARGKALFIMNDRPDIAALADADGVHVGQDELAVRDARSIVGPRAIIGVSTHSLEQARQAVREGADYLGCGPTFPSTTKSFAQFAGLAFLRQVAVEIDLPAFAIGGIALDNVAQVLATGMQRVALSGALAASSDIAASVQQWRRMLGSETASPPPAAPAAGSS
jgi:thiamine-phosphate pyrophosphorylase